MKLTTHDPVMQGVSFLLDVLELRLAQCDCRRLRGDLPGLQSEVCALAAAVADLGLLVGVRDSAQSETIATKAQPSIAQPDRGE